MQLFNGLLTNACVSSKPNDGFLDLCTNRRRGLAPGQVFSLRKVRPTAPCSAETHLYYFV